MGGGGGKGERICEPKQVSGKIEADDAMLAQWNDQCGGGMLDASRDKATLSFSLGSIGHLGYSVYNIAVGYGDL